MYCTLNIVRYPKYLGFAGFLSMALFRFPLWFSRKNSFWKLLGCGRNGTFDKSPDWRQWALLQVWKGEEQLAAFTNPKGLLNMQPRIISGYWRLFKCEVFTVVLQAEEGHGLWDGEPVFGSLPKKGNTSTAPVAVLTRATIRLKKLNRFWGHVNAVAVQMKSAPGFIYSVGIGEAPFVKQATFSVWQSRAHMQQFAYQMKEHREVVVKTHKEQWYSEEMFVRFSIVAAHGTLHGVNPLQTVYGG